MQKAGIYIDGRNFEIGALYTLGERNDNKVSFLQSNVNFKKFFKGFTGNRSLICSNYYRGFPTPRNFSLDLCKEIGSYLNFLSKQNIHLYKGHYTRNNTEKGVDVRMALDIVRDARDKKVDAIFLFSNDTDLIDAVKDATEHGATIYHCIFKGEFNKKYSPNNALSVSSHKRLILNRQLKESIQL